MELQSLATGGRPPVSNFSTARACPPVIGSPGRVQRASWSSRSVSLFNRHSFASAAAFAQVGFWFVSFGSGALASIVAMRR